MGWARAGLSAIGLAVLVTAAAASQDKLAVLVTAAAASQDKKPAQTPPQVNALLACRNVTDSAERLACYDKAAATISDAVAKQDLVVFDREGVRKTKRGLFGFSIPNLGVFDDDDQVEIKQV
ncbi:MAG TPA: hypothetical protein VGD23_03800, partial [Sphingomicrobium sp.]